MTNGETANAKTQPAGSGWEHGCEYCATLEHRTVHRRELGPLSFWLCDACWQKYCAAPLEYKTGIVRVLTGKRREAKDGA